MTVPEYNGIQFYEMELVNFPTTALVCVDTLTNVIALAGLVYADGTYKPAPECYSMSRATVNEIRAKLAMREN